MVHWYIFILLGTTQNKFDEFQGIFRQWKMRSFGMKKLSFEKHQGPLRSRPARALIMKYHHTPAVGHKWWSREKILHLRKHFSNKCILGYTDICEVKYIPFRRTYCDKFTTEMMRLKLGKTTCWHDNSNNFRNVCKCVLWFCLQPSCFKMMFFSVYSTHCAHLCDSIVTERSMLKNGCISAVH